MRLKMICEFPQTGLSPAALMNLTTGKLICCNEQ
jgi:hypothetical protein